MIFEKFDSSKHDSWIIASLIYDVDFRTYDMLYKDKNKCIAAFERELLYDEDFENYIVVLDDNHNIIGFCSYYIDKYPLTVFKETIYLFKVLKFTDACKLAIVKFLDSRVLCEINKGDFYIAEIATCPNQRGKGIGKKVLLHFIEIAKEKGCDRVILDADFRNTGAFKLYESLGFKLFRNRCFKFLSFKRGMRNMEYKLK